MYNITKPKTPSLKVAKNKEISRKKTIPAYIYFETILNLLRDLGYNAITFEQYSLDADEVGEFAVFYVENFHPTGNEYVDLCDKLIDLAHEKLDVDLDYIEGSRFCIENVE